MINTLQDFVEIIKKNNIDFTSIVEIGSRDGKDADLLKKKFDILDENVHIIEPNPVCFNKIKTDYPNYNVYEIAISNKVGRETFYQVNTLHEDLNGLSSLLYREIYETPVLDVKQIGVIVKTADVFITENKIEKCIVKIDVEGLTYEVLEGFGDTLKDIIAIHLESEAYPIWEKQKTTNDIFQLLSDQFVCLTKKRVTEQGHHIQYDEIWVNKNNYHCTLDNFFDKIFYINMDKDIDRNQNIIDQFKKYNITNYERVSGTVLETVPHNSFWRNFNNKYSLSKKYILGCLGLRNSHWRIMETSLNRGYEKILILEDDIQINRDPNLTLYENIKQLQDWDMIYFGGIEEHEFGGQIVQTHAYGINRKLIEEAYFMLPTCGMEVDNFYAKIIYHMSYNDSFSGRYSIKKMEPFGSISQNKKFISTIK